MRAIGPNKNPGDWPGLDHKQISTTIPGSAADHGAGMAVGTGEWRAAVIDLLLHAGYATVAHGGKIVTLSRSTAKIWLHRAIRYRLWLVRHSIRWPRRRRAWLRL